jgi:hypothetical protein
LAVFALVVQLLALPYHQARASGAYVPIEGSVAALKATFGDVAALCSETDRKGAPGPAGGCDDRCPLCRFASQSAALVAPDAPALTARDEGAFRTLGAAPERGALPFSSGQPNRVRAPPLAA